MIINGVSLLMAQPIKDMLSTKQKAHGVSHGLSEVGYDIRIKQTVMWVPPDQDRFLQWSNPNEAQCLEDEAIQRIRNEAFFGYTCVFHEDGTCTTKIGKTALASSVELFQLPRNLWGELRNKSTHARRFIDATIGTDMEPGWEGALTIELIFHGLEPITIPAGSGIAKAVFHEIKNKSSYTGKYQNQEDKPVPAILEKE